MSQTPQDPRSKNEVFQGALSSVVDQYAARYTQGLKAVSTENLQKAIELILACTSRRGMIWVVGNGGSSAIADHLCCDWTKGTHHAQHPTIRSASLSSNVALLTALANDFSFREAYATQVKFYAQTGDLLIAISSSGNSDNIIAAVTEARSRGVPVIGLSGFSGGRLREMADVSLHVPVNNYGLVEDVHQSLMHIIAQSIARQRDHGS
jgi:D-sedoheptulose 7-phosphate isomerase